MPRKLINDYSFYKIVNINGDIDLCYVGSTANFKERVKSHRQACNNDARKEHHLKVYKTIRENGGWCEFKMIPIGTAEQLTLTQAHIIEERYRVELKAELNSQKCFTTPEEIKERVKEYGKKNKEQIASQSKEYYEENKEKIKERVKEYGKKNKEKIIEKGKEYYEKKKEKLVAKSKENYEKNKENLAEKMTCECGCIVSKSCLYKHKQSAKHIKLINNI